MRIRRDSLFISSVLFTIALLCLVPWSLSAALASHDKAALQALDVGFRAVAETMSDLGVVSLATISIGLIVTWAGYVNGVRWTWFIMCIIVWGWAFPLLALPVLQHHHSLTLSELLYSALHEPGPPRSLVESVTVFALMLLALLLSIRSLFLARNPPEPIRRPSPWFIGGSAMTVLVIVIALLSWIRFSIHEIPLTELNSTQRLPPPPPPPTPGKPQ
jgi:hypothetical protein